MKNEVSTPCIKQCKLDNDVCFACKRTKSEIISWMKLDEAERIKIIQSLVFR